MRTIIINPVSVHRQLWGSIIESQYGDCLKATESEKQALTIQLLHTALEEIFLSVPHIPGANYDDHIAPFVDQKKLHAKLLEEDLVDAPKHTVVSRRVRGGSSILGPAIIAVENVKREILPSSVKLAAIAFDNIYIGFQVYIEMMIRNALRENGHGTLNPYSEVKLDISNSRETGRIVAIKIILGEDIRHVFYRKWFKNGRYDPDCVPEKYSSPELPEDNE